MRIITVQFTVPESYEADYSDVVAELVMADFFDGNGYDEAKIISDSAPPAGTPRAVVDGVVCECESPDWRENETAAYCWNCGKVPSVQPRP